ncbi:long-chain fatty acid--CoA ligase [Acidobacteria bacterium ACD]|nr:MAG: long-chain fatty acid--CoA ligase [Acidobacteriota bacterium]MCE7958414.1 long-chain fatty acid--CoA ligase [Acidobacteria bacterium ACB2]MDL1948484.1 long-chain fatty acid--CoA ligase [Acidobacteria bacterium ACD]
MSVPRTVIDFWKCDLENVRPDHLTMAAPSGDRTLSTETFRDRTVRLSKALAGLGVKRGDRVMLLSENRPEWHVADLAIVGLGAADVPVYPTLLPAQIAYQVNDSGCEVAIVDQPQQVEKFLSIRKECPKLEHVVQMDGEAAAGVLRMDDLVEGAGGDAEAAYWDAAAKVKPEDLLTIIYTSGTTGEPKGVMLTHDNAASDAVASVPKVPLDSSDVALEFLPLCHSLERALGYAYMWRGARRVYCAVLHVGDLIARIRPTVFVGVPRFYEKVYAKIHDKVAAAPPIRQKLFRWAVAQGKAAFDERMAGREPSGLLGLTHAVADKVVLSKIRQAMGGQVKFCASGGAPLPLYVNEFFHSIGVPILEGYGLTETSPVVSMNATGRENLRLGTVGKPLEIAEVRIAEDGEILVKGSMVMKGYWNKPDATAEAIGTDGFFRTGDVGVIDPDGFLRITDRKKDLIITAGGKNVAPAPIESELKRCPLVDNAVVIGDRRPFLVALLSPSAEGLARFAQERGLGTADVSALARDPAVLAALQEHVDRVNASLPRFEQVKKFHVLPEPMTMEKGYLTPTLKVKRRVAEKELATTIEGMYAGGGD